jgi:hypothetical protein
VLGRVCGGQRPADVARGQFELVPAIQHPVPGGPVHDQAVGARLPGQSSGQIGLLATRRSTVRARPTGSVRLEQDPSAPGAPMRPGAPALLPWG